MGMGEESLRVVHQTAPGDHRELNSFSSQGWRVEHDLQCSPYYNTLLSIGIISCNNAMVEAAHNPVAATAASNCSPHTVLSFCVIKILEVGMLISQSSTL